MPPVQGKPPEDDYFVHEEALYRTLCVIAFVVAVQFGGWKFMLTLVLGCLTYVIPAIFGIWWVWRDWYIRREHRRRRTT